MFSVNRCNLYTIIIIIFQIRLRAVQMFTESVKRLWKEHMIKNLTFLNIHPNIHVMMQICCDNGIEIIFITVLVWINYPYVKKIKRSLLSLIMSNEEIDIRRAAEAIRKYKYHIISFLLGFVIGGVIFFIITYNAINSSRCENFIPITIVGNSKLNVSM